MKTDSIITSEWVNRFNYTSYPVFNYNGTSFDKIYGMVRRIKRVLNNKMNGYED